LEEIEMTEEEVMEFDLNIHGYDSPTSADAPKAVIYARVSTDMQSDSSIEQQVRDLKGYVARKGYRLVAIYHETGSGTETETRRQFQDMMNDIKSWDIVLAVKLDRFHRNRRNLDTWVDTVIDNGKNFVALDADIDTSTIMGRAMLDFMGIINELEVKMTRVRTISGMKGKKNKGKYVGRPPYGYDSKFSRTESKEDKGLLEVNTAESIVVQNIFASFRKGSSPKMIADDLNDAGVPTKRSGSIWISNTIRSILANEILYLGIYYDEDGIEKEYSWEGILEG
jgi:site-specific DNA recombinase